MNTITAGIHDLDEVLTQLRIVVVDIATMEITDKMLIVLLLSLSVTMEPSLELCATVSWELTVMIDLHHFVQHRLCGRQAQEEVGQRRYERSHRTDKIGIGQHAVTQTGAVLTVLDAGFLNDVAYFDAMRTGYLTTLTVETEFQSLVEEVGILHSVAHQIRSGMLRSRVVGLYSRHRAVDRTNAALQTLFEVVSTEIMELNLFRHNR